VWLGRTTGHRLLQELSRTLFTPLFEALFGPSTQQSKPRKASVVLMFGLVATSGAPCPITAVD